MENENEIQMTIRMSSTMHRQFLDAAKRNDRRVAQVIREFVREYVRKHGQGDLFATAREK